MRIIYAEGFEMTAFREWSVYYYYYIRLSFDCVQDTVKLAFSNTESTGLCVGQFTINYQFSPRTMNLYIASPHPAPHRTVRGMWKEVPQNFGSKAIEFHHEMVCADRD